jgi:hypothetical protein
MRGHREALVREGANNQDELVVASRQFYARVQQLGIERRLRLGAFSQLEEIEVDLRLSLSQEIDKYTATLNAAARGTCAYESACLIACLAAECAKLTDMEATMAPEHVASAAAYMSRITAELATADLATHEGLNEVLLRHLEGVAAQGQVPRRAPAPLVVRPHAGAELLATVAPRVEPALLAATCPDADKAQSAPSAHAPRQPREPGAVKQSRWLYEGPPASIYAQLIENECGAAASAATNCTELAQQLGPEVAPSPNEASVPFVHAPCQVDREPLERLYDNDPLRFDATPSQLIDEQRPPLRGATGRAAVAPSPPSDSPPPPPPTRLLARGAESSEASITRNELYVMLCHYRDQSTRSSVQVAWGEQLRLLAPGPPKSNMLWLQQLATGARIFVPEIMVSQLRLVTWGSAPCGARARVAVQYFEPAWEEIRAPRRRAPRFEVGSVVCCWENVTVEMSAALVHEESPGCLHAVPSRVPLMILEFALAP